MSLSLSGTSESAYPGDGFPPPSSLGEAVAQNLKSGICHRFTPESLVALCGAFLNTDYVVRRGEVTCRKCLGLVR